MSNLISRLFPVGEIKVSLMIVIAIYAVFQFFELKSDLTMQRDVSLESRREGQTITIKSSVYQAPVITEKVLLQLDIHTASEFILLSSGEADDCFLTSLVKLSLCILLVTMVWHLDFTDPFNPVHLKRVKLVCNLLIVVLMIISFKNVYTSQWVHDFMGVQSYRGKVYTYNVGYYNMYYILLVWLVRMVISFYQKGVQNQQELELTI